MKKTQRLIIFVMLFWAGFVSSISFMEAWLKFRADGLTREVGLSIGKLIFTALNRVEIFMLILVWLLCLSQRKACAAMFKYKNAWLWVITVILALQTFWLLPQLLHNAQIIIDGGNVSTPFLHIWFGLLEITKVFLLILMSFKIYNHAVINK